jgi:hypothetical protein
VLVFIEQAEVARRGLTAMAAQHLQPEFCQHPPGCLGLFGYVKVKFSAPFTHHDRPDPGSRDVLIGLSEIADRGGPDLVGKINLAGHFFLHDAPSSRV